MKKFGKNTVKRTNNPRKIDECMKMVVSILNNNGIKTVACCCGHGKYPMTIVAQIKGFPVEIFSGRRIPRYKKFYKKDKKGMYYIPESIEE